MHRESIFRDRIGTEPGARFAPEPGRYHLYVMFGCPWAHRTLIVRALKGLESAIGMTAVHHHLVDGEGWAFAPERPDPLHGFRHLRQLYELARPGYDGRVTVPLLWDTRERAIVNNESTEIMRMFATQFDAHAANPTLDLYPEPLRPAIDRWNERIQRDVNEGAYAAGYPSDQAGYERAAKRFFDTLDQIDRHLATSRFLVGDAPTEADWRLFPTLIRWEWVYESLFRLGRGCVKTMSGPRRARCRPRRSLCTPRSTPSQGSKDPRNLRDFAFHTASTMKDRSAPLRQRPLARAFPSLGARRLEPVGTVHCRSGAVRRSTRRCRGQPRYCKPAWAPFRPLP